MARIASTWRSTGRRPIRSPPGLLMTTSPKRGEERPQEHEAGAHLGRGLERHEQPVDVARGDLVDVRRGMVDDDAEVGERLGHRAHVLDLGHVAEPAALAGQGRGGEHLQRRVLGAADPDRALERRRRPSRGTARAATAGGSYSQWNGLASAMRVNST